MRLISTNCPGNGGLRDNMEYNILDEYSDGYEYDAENTSGDEINFYLGLAHEFGGPILDLACGTGRLTIPLAQAGYATTGLDIAAPMVEHGRRKGAGLPVQWHVADCRSFQLDERFALITMTGNSFQAFLTRPDQEAVLACIREHLQAGGIFAFEVRNPYLETFDTPQEEFWRSYTNRTGQTFDISTTQRYDKLAQVMDYTNYRRWQANGEEQLRITHLYMRFFYPQEMEALLYYNGLKVMRSYGDWALHPIAEDSPRMIYVCQA
ncbi:MAG: class I SAM-dependent methyltransferase [Anaerolineae bacterium]